MKHSKTKVTKKTTSTRTITQITFDHVLDSYTHNLLIDFEKDCVLIHNCGVFLDGKRGYFFCLARVVAASRAA